MAEGDVYSAARLVDGVIVLGCATEECCLYPWPGMEEPFLYPTGDLPATIVITTDAYGAETANLTGPYLYESASYTITSSGPPWLLIYNPTFEPLGTSTCLIGSYSPDGSVEDEFSASYTVTYLGVEPPEEYTVTRVSLCKWETGDGLTWLEYIYNSETLDTKWNLHIQNATLEMSKVDDSTPVGDYDNGAETATVS